MAHKRRGRKPNPNARRRQTTRAGRRGEVDLGSDALRYWKMRLTGRPDLELVPSAVLYGRDLINAEQFDKLGWLCLLLRRISAACGRGFTVGGLWASLLAAGSRGTSFQLPLLGDQNARMQLSVACRSMNGSRELIIGLAEGIEVPGLVLRAVERQLTAEDMQVLEQLRADLDAFDVPRWYDADTTSRPLPAAP
jgi:hypothetical protein